MNSRADTLRLLARRVGGPNSVTWPGFVITLALALALNLVTVGVGSAAEFGRGLISLLLGQSAAYALLVLARWTVLRGARLRPLPVRTLVAFALASLVGGIAAGALTASFAASSQGTTEPPSPATALVALVATLVSATVVLAVAALVVDTWREHRANVVRLMVLDERIANLGEERGRVADEAADAVRDQLAVAIAERLSTLKAPTSTRMADALTTVVDDVVRPMSRALFVPTRELEHPPVRRVRPDYRVAVIDATEPPLLLPVSLAAFVGMLVLFSTLLAEGLAVALSVTVLTVATIIVVCLLANAIFARVASQLDVAGRLVALIGSMAVLELALMIAWTAFTPLGSQPLHRWALAGVVLIVAVLLTGAKLASSVTVRQEREVSDMEERVRWEEARSQLVHWEAGSVLAEALHGPVQSSLLAAALRLEAPSAQGEPPPGWMDSATVIAAALEAFTGGVGNDSDVLTTLTSLRRTWSPLCEIRWDINPEVADRLAADAIGARAATAVLIEACSNAVRHGQAERVDVDITSTSAHTIDIVVDDSGTSGAVDNPPGGGTALLDAVSLRWHRSRRLNGSTLTVTLPIARTP